MNNAATVAIQEKSQTTENAVREVLSDNVMPADYGLYEIPLSRIRRDPSIDPRKHRNKARYERMCASFSEEGIMQAITVRPVERDESGADLEVVAGNTRYDGANEVGLTTIPALVRYVDAKQAAVMAGIENMERQDLSPVEEGFHAARLLKSLNNDHDEVMRVLDWSRTKLNSRIMLTHVTEMVQDALVQGDLKIGHVELLAGIPKKEHDRIAGKIIEEGYSVQETKEKLAKGTSQLKRAPFPLDDCQGCQFNSSTMIDLFASAEDMGKGFCSNIACWDEKTKKQLDIIVTDAKESFGTVHLSTEITEDGFTALEATGENGVGKSQLSACVSCEHYGAVVSSKFGSEGQVREGLCFNLECHGEKVTTYRNVKLRATQGQVNEAGASESVGVQQPTPEESQSGAEEVTGEASGAAEEKPAPQKAAPITPASLKKGIKREAMQRFQQMGQDGIASHPRIGAAIALITLCKELVGMGFPEWVRKQAEETLLGLQDKAMDFRPISSAEGENGATILARLSADELCEGMAALGSLTVWRLDGSEQFEKHGPHQSAMFYATKMEVDRKAYPSMTEGYMKAQVKVGLIEDCKQSGFAEAYDAEKGEKAFATLAKGKAKDLIGAIADFKQFDWSHYEPLGFGVEFYSENAQ